MMGTIQAQLNALRQLANALHNAKGRKTAIWLTGYFPIDVNEAEGSLNIENWNTTSGFPVKAASIEYQRTVDLLNDSQISVFPVQLTSGRVSSNLPGPVTADHTIVGLRLIARSTDGEEMALADGIDTLVQHALAKSTNYYLISIQAESRRDLTWESLKIATNDKSLQVRSPNGLFLIHWK